MMSIDAYSWPWCCARSRAPWCRRARDYANCAGGKRGGLRVLYYWDKEPETVYLLFVYEKTKQADLTPEQAKALGRLIRQELK